jgi:hypothetical protein
MRSATARRQPGYRYPNFIAPEGHLWYRFYENK